MTTPTTKNTKNLTDAQKAEIKALHAAGASRNAIARQTGINSAMVSTYAREAGLTFNTRITEAATRAKDSVIALRRAGASAATGLGRTISAPKRSATSRPGSSGGAS